MSTKNPITVPEGFTLHTENTSLILLPSSNEAFLNPVQEFNRDTSVACIRVWSEELNKAKEAKWRRTRDGVSKKVKDGAGKKRLKSEFTISRPDGISSGCIIAESDTCTNATASDAIPSEEASKVITDDGLVPKQQVVFC